MHRNRSVNPRTIWRWERPGRIAVQTDEDRAVALIDVVNASALDVDKMAVEREHAGSPNPAALPSRPPSCAPPERDPADAIFTPGWGHRRWFAWSTEWHAPRRIVGHTRATDDRGTDGGRTATAAGRCVAGPAPHRLGGFNPWQVFADALHASARHRVTGCCRDGVLRLAGADPVHLRIRGRARLRRAIDVARQH